MDAVSRGDSFGLVEGREARLFTLQSDRLRARVTNYGGILVSLETPDRGAAWDHVVLGFDDIAGYLENRGSFGALLTGTDITHKSSFGSLAGDSRSAPSWLMCQRLRSRE